MRMRRFGKKSVRMPGKVGQKMIDEGRRGGRKTGKVGQKMIDEGRRGGRKTGKMTDEITGRGHYKRKARRRGKRIQRLEAELQACQEEKGCPPCEEGGPNRPPHPHGGPPGLTGFKKKKKKRGGLRGYGNNPYFSDWNI